MLYIIKNLISPKAASEFNSQRGKGYFFLPQSFSDRILLHHDSRMIMIKSKHESIQMPSEYIYTISNKQK